MGAWGIYERRRAGYLKDQVRQLYHYDKKYFRFYTRCSFREAEVPGFWAARYHVERDFVALKSVRHWTWTVNRRTEDDMPFSVHPPVISHRHATRTGSGECHFLKPHKSGANFSFRVEFDPPLRPGERAQISVDIDFPVMKPATLAQLRLRPASPAPVPGEAEFSSTDIESVIDEFVKEIVIPERLGSRRHGLQVLRRSAEFDEEATFVREHECFQVNRSRVDNQPVWNLRLERFQPPIKTCYRTYWELPNADEPSS
jgi:hypothetical protein